MRALQRGELPPTLRNLLEVVRIKASARRTGLTSVTLEDGVVVLRAPRPIANRERLHGAFGEEVQVGSTQVRILQRGDWRAMLRRVLERLGPAAEPVAPPAERAPEHYGTFAPSATTPKRAETEYGTFAPAWPKRSDGRRPDRRPSVRKRR